MQDHNDRILKNNKMQGDNCEMQEEDKKQADSVNNKSKDKDSQWYESIPLVIFLIVIAFVLYLGIAFFIYKCSDHSSWAASRGPFGDSFGLLNPFISLLAFVGLIVSINLQRKDLKLQRDDLELQRDEMKAQKVEMAKQANSLEEQSYLMKRQSFEQTFASFLNELNNARSQFRYTQQIQTGMGDSGPKYDYHEICGLQAIISFNSKIYTKIVEHLNNSVYTNVYNEFSKACASNVPYSNTRNLFLSYTAMLRLLNNYNLNEADNDFYKDYIYGKINHGEAIIMFFYYHSEGVGSNDLELIKSYRLLDNAQKFVCDFFQKDIDLYSRFTFSKEEYLKLKNSLKR